MKMARNEISTMFEKSPDDIVRTLFHDAQSDI